MCVILCCEKEFPNEELLKSCEISNPHGAGVSWLDKERNVHYVKGIDAKEIHKMIKGKKIELPCIVHFRIASVGTSSGEDGKLLTHPFEITRESKLRLEGVLKRGTDGVLFHNGTLSDYEKILKDVVLNTSCRMLKGVYSDSRIMAFATSFYGKEFIEILDNDSYNKYAVMDKDGIHKYGDWNDDEKQKDIKVSNTYYNAPVYNVYEEYGIGFGGVTYTKDEYTKDDLCGMKPNETYTKEDATKEIQENSEYPVYDFFDRPTPKDKIKSIVLEQTKKVLSKRKQKKLRKKNIAYLKSLGWITPHDLSNSSLEEAVNIENKQMEIRAKVFSDRKAKIKNSKNAVGNMLEEYETIYNEYKKGGVI